MNCQPQIFSIDLNVVPQVPEDDGILHDVNVELNNMDCLPNKKNVLSADTKRAVFETLLIEREDGKLPRGVISKVANSFSISTRSVSRIWQEVKSITNTEHIISVFQNKLLNRSCRKRVELSLEQIKSIPLCRRSNIRSLSKQLGVARSTVHRRIQDGNIRPHSNPIKPYLSDDNKKTRLEFCLSMVNQGEEFNGKIGIWPFVSYEPAKRNSKNRVAGTLEAKPIVSVTKDVIRSYMLEKLLPSINEKWPRSSSRTIFVQQDNARPHLDVNDVKFVQEANKDGFDIRLCCQPPNSPDMNVLDLGFFRALDSLQHQEAPSTIDEFVVAVQNAFEKFPSEELNNVFLTLQSCMAEVMKSSGGNNYKIPHMNKQKLIRDGRLPTCIQFETEVSDMARASLESG